MRFTGCYVELLEQLGVFPLNIWNHFSPFPLLYDLTACPSLQTTAEYRNRTDVSNIGDEVISPSELYYRACYVLKTDLKETSDSYPS